MALRKKKSLVGQATDYVEALKPHVESALESAAGFVSDTALPALSDARDKAVPALVEARDKAVPVILDARDKAVPVLLDARDKAAPVLADARDKAVSGLSDARAAAAPLISQGADYAAERASVARDVADAKVAQLKGEPAPRSAGKLKRLALVLGVAGAVAVVARRLQGGKKVDSWQSNYTPTPAPTPAAAPPVTPSAPQAGLDDPAGAAPGEAIADAAVTEAPPVVSTPDEPVTVIDIDPPLTP